MQLLTTRTLHRLGRVTPAVKPSAPPPGQKNQQRDRITLDVSTALADMSLDGDQTLESSQVVLAAEIGDGSFTKVYACKVRYSKDAEVDAVAKIMHQPTQENMADLVNECILWSRLEHPHVVRFLSACATDGEIWLILERFHGGSLDKHLERKLHTAAEAMSTSCVLDWSRQIAEGMEFLHALEPPILHRDLKSGNVLMSDNLGSRLAIGDFGVARYQSLDTSKAMTAETGSYRWMAPEVIRHEVYDKRCDVYSFAMLVFELLTYRFPFDGKVKLTPMQVVAAVAVEDKRPELPSSCTAPIRRLVERCWSRDPNLRPSFAEMRALLANKEYLLTGSVETTAQTGSEAEGQPQDR